MRVKVYDNRKTTQDLINEERARLDSDFKARLKNAEESMKQMYPEAYRDIRSKYFGNGNPLGLAGSQYNYIHDIITRNSKNQMQKYYNDLNDYFTKQTGSQAGYMLPEVTVEENADDVNWSKLRNEAIGEIQSENSDYLANVDRQKALDAYYRANQNGVVDVEDKYNRAHQPTKEEQKWNDTWERAQNSPIVTAMEFSPLFPVVAGVKGYVGDRSTEASLSDVALNTAMAAIPTAALAAHTIVGPVAKTAYNQYRINRNIDNVVNNTSRYNWNTGENINLSNDLLNDFISHDYQPTRALLDADGNLSFMSYFNMTPRQVLEQIEKDKSLIDVGKKFKVNSLSTDSYPLVLHTMSTKKSPNFNVLYNGETMRLNNLGNLKGEDAVNRINKKITELNKDRKLSIPLAKLEPQKIDNESLEAFYKYGDGMAARKIRHNFKSIEDFKKAYVENKEVKNLVDGILGSTLEDITVPYLEAIRMYNHGGVLDATYIEQINRIRQPRFAGWRFKDGGIYIKKENRGKFTEQAQRSGMTTKQFTSEVLENPNKYSPTTVKRARFSRNIGGN